MKQTLDQLVQMKKGRNKLDKNKKKGEKPPAKMFNEGDDYIPICGSIHNHNEIDNNMVSEFTRFVYFHGCNNTVISYILDLKLGSWYYCDGCRNFQKIKEVH